MKRIFVIRRSNFFINTIGQETVKNEYNRAFEYYQQAFEMRQKIISEEHDDIVESFHNRGEIFH
jgi:hypothetical protein